MMRSRFARSQRQLVVNGILLFVVVLVVLQLWLLSATLNAQLGGDTGVAIPALLASGACLLLNLGLLRYVYRLD